ncbi:MAG: ABC transporter permease [Desulfobacterales bacterium]
MQTLLRYSREMILMAVVVFCFTTFVLLISGASPLAAYYHLLKGSLGSWSKISHVITVWIPLTLCSCGLLFTFRIGLWNIGVEGQMMMGAVLSTALLRLGLESTQPVVFIGLAFVAGALGGAIWAFFAGLLKAKGGVHEIFAGLGLNFVAQGIILYLIFGPWKRPGVASMSGTEVFPQTLWLPFLSKISLSPFGLVLAFASVLVTAWMLRYTWVGLGLKAIGKNPYAAFLFGLKPGRYMLLAMVFAGGFAGIAGGLQVTGIYHRLIPAISSNYGYLSLLVVMLSNYNIWAAPAVAFFFACLNIGSIQLPMMLQVDSALSGVIQGALVLATLVIYALQTRRKRKEGQR